MPNLLSAGSKAREKRPGDEVGRPWQFSSPWSNLISAFFIIMLLQFVTPHHELLLISSPSYRPIQRNTPSLIARNTQYNIASAVSDVIVLCWIFCSLSNKSWASVLLGAVHKHGKQISPFVIVCCCNLFSVKEFDNLGRAADAWDGEHLTKSWGLKGKLCWNYEF